MCASVSDVRYKSYPMPDYKSIRLPRLELCPTVDATRNIAAPADGPTRSPHVWMCLKLNISSQWKPAKPDGVT